MIKLEYLLVPLAMPLCHVIDGPSVVQRRYIYVFGIRLAFWTVT